MLPTIFIPEDFVKPCNFAGQYDAHIKYQNGDIVALEDSLYIVSDGNEWHELGPATADEQEEILYRCTSCGAPTNSNGVCPYCGTINRRRR